MASTFNPGDLVRLKSGGPVMTVEDVGNYSGYSVGPEDGAKCVWFEKTKRFSEVFDTRTLELVADR